MCNKSIFHPLILFQSGLSHCWANRFFFPLLSFQNKWGPILLECVEFILPPLSRPKFIFFMSSKWQTSDGKTPDGKWSSLPVDTFNTSRHIIFIFSALPTLRTLIRPSFKAARLYFYSILIFQTRWVKTSPRWSVLPGLPKGLYRPFITLIGPKTPNNFWLTSFGFRHYSELN